MRSLLGGHTQFILHGHSRRKSNFSAVLAIILHARYIYPDMTATSFNASTADPWRPMVPGEGTQFLVSLTVPWWIAGGWALDLFAETQTRAHKDLDVGVLRTDAVRVASALEDWEVFEARRGTLTHLQSGREPRADVNSLWCRPAGAKEWVMELMLNDAEDNFWVYRRDRRIRSPLQVAIRHSREGIPYLAPEIQLLFKSHATRPQDLADFESMLPRLDRAARAWLRGAIAKADHLHPWLHAIDSTKSC